MKHFSESDDRSDCCCWLLVLWVNYIIYIFLCESFYFAHLLGWQHSDYGGVMELSFLLKPWVSREMWFVPNGCCDFNSSSCIRKAVLISIGSALGGSCSSWMHHRTTTSVSYTNRVASSWLFFSFRCVPFIPSTLTPLLSVHSPET